MSITWWFWLVALAVVGLFVYWHLRARQHSRAQPHLAHHPRWLQITLRAALPALTVLLALQLFGVINFSLPLTPETSSIFFWTGFVLFWGSSLLAIWARETLGIYWAHAADYQIIPGQALITDGPYRYVRHPMYLAFIGIFIGVELLLGSWLILLAIPLVSFFIWQSKQEEFILEQEFGQAYRDYQQKTGMLLPKLKLQA